MAKIPGTKEINIDRSATLPRLPPPAGYVLLIMDVAYGNRYKIERVQQLDRRLLKRGADLPFETSLARILKANDAAAAAQALHKQLAGDAQFDSWFDMDPAGPRRIGSLARAPASRRTTPTRETARPRRRASSAPNRGRRGRRAASLIIALLLMSVVISMFTGRELVSEVLTRLESALLPTPTALRRSASDFALAAPHLTILSKSPTRISFSWSAVSGATSYEYDYTKPGKTNVGWHSTSSHQASITGLSSGERIKILVRARRGGATSPVARLSAQTAALPSPTPAYVPPTATRLPLAAPEVTILSKSPTRISFSWSAVSGATSYEYGYIGQGKPNIRWRSATSQLASITGLSSGERIKILVRARRGGEKSTMASLDVYTVLAPAANQTDIPPTATNSSTPTEIPPTPTNSSTPTDIPPTATYTSTPTDIPPTATYTSTPTEIPPTATYTARPTEIPPTATYTSTPTDIPPTATYTSTPTDIPPTATNSSTPTEIPPTATHTSTPSATPPTETLIIWTAGDVNARVRECPGTGCAIVGRMRPGDQLQPIGRVRGERVYGSPVWIEFTFEGKSAFVHSSLTRAAP